MEVQDHVNCAIFDGGVLLGRSIIKEPNCCVTGCLRCFQLLGNDGANSNEHGRVDRDSVV